MVGSQGERSEAKGKQNGMEDGVRGRRGERRTRLKELMEKREEIEK